MRRTAALCVVAVLLAGCRGDSDDSDTSTAAGGGSSGTTMAMGGAGHTDHLGNPTSACSPAGSSVTITANGTKFDKDCLAAPASQAFTITIDNKDSLPHNIAILEKPHRVRRALPGRDLPGAAHADVQRGRATARCLRLPL
ncbi:MAG: hypothetical protein ACRD2W_23705 [Acidimicrobiales bacterium]